MKKIVLNPSNIIFNEKEHTYHLDGKQLSGITGMLERQLFPNEYDGIPQDKMEAKAEFGHTIHGDIELFDNGVDVQTEYTRSYANLKKEQNISTIDNEYIVTDGEHFASPIDIVVTKDGDDIWLVDTKTVYNLNHEKVAWQLSIYKYLFEKQNPHLKVKGIACLWFKIRKEQLEETQFIDLTQLLRSEEEVQKLFDCEVNGIQYVDTSKTALTIPVDVQEQICIIEEQVKELKAKQDELRAGLLKTMQAKGIKSFKSDRLLLTRKLGGVSRRFDSKAFEVEHPDLYKQYIKEIKTSDSIIVKVYETK